MNSWASPQEYFITQRGGAATKEKKETALPLLAKDESLLAGAIAP
jgi:hypothetical protein